MYVRTLVKRTGVNAMQLAFMANLLNILTFIILYENRRSEIVWATKRQIMLTGQRKTDFPRKCSLETVAFGFDLLHRTKAWRPNSHGFDDLISNYDDHS
jgi:hypothetical protein